MTNFFSPVYKKPLINSILRFAKEALIKSGWNSLSPESASPRLNQYVPKQNHCLNVSFFTALTLFFLQINLCAADSVEKVLIGADHMHLNIESGHSVYTGNVKISQGELAFSGDKVTLEQKNNEIKSITVTGKPARYNHVTEKGETIKAESEHMVYRASQNKLEMSINARLQQPGHQVSSQKITYDTLRKIIIAGGKTETSSNNATTKTGTGSKASNNSTQNQRVNITLTPKEKLKPSEEAEK